MFGNLNVMASFLYIYFWLTNSQTLARGLHGLISVRSQDSLIDLGTTSVELPDVAATTPAFPLVDLSAVPIRILRGKSGRVQSPQLALGRVLLLTHHRPYRVLAHRRCSDVLFSAIASAWHFRVEHTCCRSE